MSNVARRKAEVFVGNGEAGSAADATKAPKKTALKKATKRFMQSMVLRLKPLGEIGGNPCLRMEPPLEDIDSKRNKSIGKPVRCVESSPVNPTLNHN